MKEDYSNIRIYRKKNNDSVIDKKKMKVSLRIISKYNSKSIFEFWQ